jgi:hypothetical protein
MEEPEAMNALSRRDNETYICSQCGVGEAMFDYKLAGWEQSLNNMADSMEAQDVTEPGRSRVLRFVRDERRLLEAQRRQERLWLEVKKARDERMGISS